MGKIKVPTRTVTLAGVEIEVRGLSVNDISLLAAKHREDLARLVSAVTRDRDPDRAIRTVLATAPGLAVELVAAAAGIEDDEDVEALEKLPATIQVQLLAAVLEMTMVSDVDLELAIEAVTGILQKVAAATEKMVPSDGSPDGFSPAGRTPPSSGNGASEKPMTSPSG